MYGIVPRYTSIWARIFPRQWRRSLSTMRCLGLAAAAAATAVAVKFNWPLFCIAHLPFFVAFGARRKWVRKRERAFTTHQIRPQFRTQLHSYLWFNFSVCTLFLSTALGEWPRYQMDIGAHRSITWWTSLPSTNSHFFCANARAWRNVNELQAPEICMIEAPGRTVRCATCYASPVDGIASQVGPPD